jgi:disulfide bond formation protein DsbB
MTARLLQFWPVVAALASLVALGSAHAFESFGGYLPCALCLRQREVYWGALALAAAGLVLVRLHRLSPGLVAGLLGAVFTAGFIVAAFHAGVEWKWWPGPATCTGPLGGPVTGDLSDLLAGKKLRPPGCDVAAWRMFGISMAGYNVALSAALAAASFWLAAKGSRHDR